MHKREFIAKIKLLGWTNYTKNGHKHIYEYYGENRKLPYIITIIDFQFEVLKITPPLANISKYFCTYKEGLNYIIKLKE